jgi:hypothetical protein
MINQNEDDEVYPDEELFSKQFHFFIIGYFDLVRVVYQEDYLDLFSDGEEEEYQIQEGDDEILDKEDT